MPCTLICLFYFRTGSPSGRVILCLFVYLFFVLYLYDGETPRDGLLFLLFMYLGRRSLLLLFWLVAWMGNPIHSNLINVCRLWQRGNRIITSQLNPSFVIYKPAALCSRGGFSEKEQERVEKEIFLFIFVLFK